MATFEVAPKSTVPGTRPWAETVAANAKRYAAFTENDVRPLVERYRALCDHEVWELFFSGQLEAKERFCRELLGYEAEFLDTMSKGVEILDGRGHHGPISTTQALDAHGGDRKSQVFRDGITNLKPPADNSADYVVRRLRRDKNPLAERVEQGEISAHAAAIQAGFRPRRISVSVARPEAVARSLLKYMSADDIAKLITLLLGKEV